jgi:hypothetical protein
MVSSYNAVAIYFVVEVPGEVFAHVHAVVV